MNHSRFTGAFMDSKSGNGVTGTAIFLAALISLFQCGCFGTFDPGYGYCDCVFSFCSDCFDTGGGGFYHDNGGLCNGITYDYDYCCATTCEYCPSGCCTPCGYSQCACKTIENDLQTESTSSKKDLTTQNVKFDPQISIVRSQGASTSIVQVNPGLESPAVTRWYSDLDGFLGEVTGSAQFKVSTGKHQFYFDAKPDGEFAKTFRSFPIDLDIE